MKCVICKSGETADGTTTVPIERDGMLLVMRGVPAQVCQNCGEAYIDSKVTREILQLAKEAGKDQVQVDIRQYHAA